MPARVQQAPRVPPIAPTPQIRIGSLTARAVNADRDR
jgi:hypothetical protein